MTTNYPYPYYDPTPPPPRRCPPARRNRHPLAVGFGAGVAAAALVFGGIAVAQSNGSNTVTGSGSVALLPSLPNNNSRAGNGGSSNGGSSNGGSSNGGSSTGGSTTQGTTATSTQQQGIVTVVSVLRYQNAESAGTGMILTSDGEVLTNNHVIDGATSVTVTVESTGRSYRADVVGTAPTKDVALLQLKNASGLQTADLASSSSGVSVGDSVTGVGNAGGTGTLTQASGTVTALDQAITASDESGANSERLRGLIETDAGIIAGDSGGPLYDSTGQIVGMDTAASPNSAQSSAYAIPIENALGVVKQIQTGVETTAIHIGLPGFLGIGPKNANGGVRVQNELRGAPAAGAGIRPGSVITSIDGTRTVNTTQLHNLLSAKGPGTSVRVVWVTPRGQQRSASVVLATGPAD